MRIVFYLRGITDGGVGRFIKEIIKALTENYDAEIYILCDRKFSPSDTKKLTISRIDTTNKIMFDYFYSKKRLIDLEPDALIYPKNVIPVTHRNTEWKKSVIIHDLGYFEKKLNAYPLLDTMYMKINIPRSCKIADTVFSVSGYTKKDLIDRFNIDSSKIEVIGEGVDYAFFSSEVKPIVELPYFFYAGSISPRKNLSRVLAAFMKISHLVPHHLYITGLKNWGDRSFLKEYENMQSRIHILGFVSEDDLVSLYRHADALLYPSLYEGFGLPILEAQAAGCPVITSNVTACPETAGEGAIIVDPYNTGEIADAMLKIASDRDVSRSLVEEGYNNLNRFSWKKTVDKIIKKIQ